MSAERSPLPRGTFAAACILAAVTLLSAYSNSFNNSFHFDDMHVVAQNLYVRSLHNVPLFFTDAKTSSSLPANALYRPLVSTTLALDYRLGGGQVWAFHLSQVAMLVVLGSMVYFMWQYLLAQVGDRWWNRYVALLAAALFSVHTTNTETLNTISARSELLSAIGLVGSFLMYFYLPSTRRLRLYLLPMMAGTLAKTPAIVFAPMLLAYMLLFEKRLSIADVFSRRSWRAVRDAVLASAPAFVIGVVTYLAVESMNAPTLNRAGGERYDYFLTQLFAWLHYGRMFVFPIGLTADSDWTRIAHWYDTRAVAGLLFICCLLWGMWKASKTDEGRPAAFGLAWFCIALLPGSSIVPLAEVTNDHRAFLAYIGLALAAVWAIALLAQHATAQSRRAAAVTPTLVVLVAIGANAVGTYERNKDWASEETLWRDVVEKSPGNGRAWMNYGLTQMSKGQFQEAKRLFERALQYSPNYHLIEVNLGIVDSQLGQQASAEQHFTRALQLQQGDPGPYYFFARWLVQQGRLTEAITHLQRSVALSPASLDGRSMLMNTYAMAGRTDEAKALAQETLKLVPGDARTIEYLSGRAAPTLPNAPPAQSAEGLLNTSLTLYQARDFQGSIEAARKALALKPDYAEAYNNIAASYASLGKWDDAIQAAQEALRLKPDFPLARNNLAWAQREKQKQR